MAHVDIPESQVSALLPILPALHLNPNLNPNPNPYLNFNLNPNLNRKPGVSAAADDRPGRQETRRPDVPRPLPG